MLGFRRCKPRVERELEMNRQAKLNHRSLPAFPRHSQVMVVNLDNEEDPDDLFMAVGTVLRPGAICKFDDGTWQCLQVTDQVLVDFPDLNVIRAFWPEELIGLVPLEGQHE
jgi:hypothetical protein